MEFISGEDREQMTFFPDSIDDYVSEDNPVRVIEAYIDGLDLESLGFIRTQTKSTGRPPYDPKDVLKLYVYGHMNRIRSSRRLETESKRNLELLWLLRRLSPDHKTIADFRRDNPKALKNVFKDFVRLCVGLDLYGKELAAIDGSKFKAVNSKDRNFTKDKLEDRLKRLDEKIDGYLAALEKTDSGENIVCTEKPPEEIKRIVNVLKERKKQYQTYAQAIERSGGTQISLTDSESRLMLANGKYEVCYNVQTAVDAKHKLIAEFSVTNDPNDKNQITPMARQVMETLEVETIAVTADMGYNSACDIAEAIQIGVKPHIAGTDNDFCIPVADGVQTGITSHKDGRCVYIAERNIAICPMGNVLYPGHYKKSKGEAIYYNRQACKQCACKCTAESRGLRYRYRMQETNFTKEYNDKALAVKQVRIKPDKAILRQRKSIVEHPFGTVKRAMDSGYCLLKGKRKISGEFSLIFLAYNLKRVINILGSKELIEKMTCLASSA